MVLLKIILIIITLILLTICIKDAYIYRNDKDIGAVIIVILYLIYIIFN